MEDEFGIPKGPNNSSGSAPTGRAATLRPDDVRRAHLADRRHPRLRVAVLIGLVVGLLAGYFGGWGDTVLSRSADVMLSLPQLLISIGIVAACSTTKEGCLHGIVQPGIRLVVAVIALFSWPYIARVVRRYTVSLREREFVEASRSLGASNCASSSARSPRKRSRKRRNDSVRRDGHGVARGSDRDADRAHQRAHGASPHPREGSLLAPELFKLVGRRRRFLNYLQKKDLEGYRALIKELGLRR